MLILDEARVSTHTRLDCPLDHDKDLLDPFVCLALVGDVTLLAIKSIHHYALSFRDHAKRTRQSGTASAVTRHDIADRNEAHTHSLSPASIPSRNSLLPVCMWHRRRFLHMRVHGLCVSVCVRAAPSLARPSSVSAPSLRRFSPHVPRHREPKLRVPGPCRPCTRRSGARKSHHTHAPHFLRCSISLRAASSCD